MTKSRDQGSVTRRSGLATRGSQSSTTIVGFSGSRIPDRGSRQDLSRAIIINDFFNSRPVRRPRGDDVLTGPLRPKPRRPPRQRLTGSAITHVSQLAAIGLVEARSPKEMLCLR